MNQENRQGCNHREPDEKNESSPHGHLAPAATTQTTGEITEALDGSCRAEGVVLGLRHYGSLLTGGTPFALLSVVVDQLDIFGGSVGPLGTDSPFLVDAVAVRTGAIALQLLESIARGDPQIAENLGSVKDQQRTEGDPLSSVIGLADSLPCPDPFGLLVSQRPDYTTVTDGFSNCKRYAKNASRTT